MNIQGKLPYVTFNLNDSKKIQLILVKKDVKVSNKFVIPFFVGVKLLYVCECDR